MAQQHHLLKQEQIRSLPEKYWWALVDDFRTLPLGQIVAGIPHIGELSLL